MSVKGAMLSPGFTPRRPDPTATCRWTLVFKGIRSLNDPQRLPTWLYQIARCTAISQALSSCFEARRRGWTTPRTGSKKADSLA